ncbi:glutamate--cysteine ligase regulatory subunit-like [Diadema antillarum]|uniref:glutamate--cysteine ligase regulatory subunit-like n=1 Tax=Diadema antillarum TaxID=105358 RepID=UPI003A8AF0F8
MSLPQRIPRATTLVLSCGNILNWGSLKRKVPKSSTEEIKFCLRQTLKNCVEKAGDTGCLQGEVIQLSDPQNAPSQHSEAREDLKVTVKLMITKSDEEEITEAVDMVLKELNLAKIDVLLLAISKRPNVIEDLTFEHYKPLWWELEREVSRGRIGALGICDADKTMLEELYNWSRVKPIIDQLNQETCCVIPPELNEYAKANKTYVFASRIIPLISVCACFLSCHLLSTDVLPPEEFQSVLGEFFPGPDSERWYPAWTLRFSVLIRCRGVITTKGYTLKALKDSD